jgi:hypothetical protein
MSTVIRGVGEDVGKRPNDKWKVNRMSRPEVNTRERTRWKQINVEAKNE